jgi:hypothetical protein
MAAWNKVLSEFQAHYDRDQQHDDVEAMPRVPETERGSNGSKSREALQTDRGCRNGTVLDWREGKDHNSADNEPPDPAGVELESHKDRFGGLRRSRARLFRASAIARPGTLKPFAQVVRQSCFGGSLRSKDGILSSLHRALVSMRVEKAKAGSRQEGPGLASSLPYWPPAQSRSIMMRQIKDRPSLLSC